MSVQQPGLTLFSQNHSPPLQTPLKAWRIKAPGGSAEKRTGKFFVSLSSPQIHLFATTNLIAHLDITAYTINRECQPTYVSDIFAVVIDLFLPIRTFPFEPSCCGSFGCFDFCFSLRPNDLWGPCSLYIIFCRRAFLLLRNFSNYSRFASLTDTLGYWNIIADGLRPIVFKTYFRHQNTFKQEGKPAMLRWLCKGRSGM